jgi:hypothetical protein
MVPGRNPARNLTGGEGKGVGKHEGNEGYLPVVLVGAGMAGGGLAAGALLTGGRRWLLAVLR